MFGRYFEIHTDHRALQFLLGTRDLSGRLARWSIALQQYNFKIVYKPGRENGNAVADALSRLPLPPVASTPASATADPSMLQPAVMTVLTRAQRARLAPTPVVPTAAHAEVVTTVNAQASVPFPRAEPAAPAAPPMTPPPAAPATDPSPRYNSRNADLNGWSVTNHPHPRNTASSWHKRQQLKSPQLSALFQRRRRRATFK